jgi:hypothetical protein
MGEHVVEQGLDEQKEQMFMKALLDDLRALDYMLDNDLIESDVVALAQSRRCFSSMKISGLRPFLSKFSNMPKIPD